MAAVYRGPDEKNTTVEVTRPRGFCTFPNCQFGLWCSFAHLDQCKLCNEGRGEHHQNSNEHRSLAQICELLDIEIESLSQMGPWLQLTMYLFDQRPLPPFVAAPPQSWPSLAEKVRQRMGGVPPPRMLFPIPNPNGRPIRELVPCNPLIFVGVRGYPIEQFLHLATNHISGGDFTVFKRRTNFRSQLKQLCTELELGEQANEHHRQQCQLLLTELLDIDVPWSIQRDPIGTRYFESARYLAELLPNAKRPDHARHGHKGASNEADEKLKHSTYHALRAAALALQAEVDESYQKELWDMLDSMKLDEPVWGARKAENFTTLNSIVPALMADLVLDGFSETYIQSVIRAVRSSLRRETTTPQTALAQFRGSFRYTDKQRIVLLADKPEQQLLLLYHDALSAAGDTNVKDDRFPIYELRGPRDGYAGCVEALVKMRQRAALHSIVAMPWVAGPVDRELSARAVTLSDGVGIKSFAFMGSKKEPIRWAAHEESRGQPNPPPVLKDSRPNTLGETLEKLDYHLDLKGVPEELRRAIEIYTEARNTTSLETSLSLLWTVFETIIKSPGTDYNPFQAFERDQNKVPTLDPSAWGNVVGVVAPLFAMTRPARVVVSLMSHIDSAMSIGRDDADLKAHLASRSYDVKVARPASLPPALSTASSLVSQGSSSDVRPTLSSLSSSSSSSSSSDVRPPLSSSYSSAASSAAAAAAAPASPPGRAPSPRMSADAAAAVAQLFRLDPAKINEWPACFTRAACGLLIDDDIQRHLLATAPWIDRARWRHVKERYSQLANVCDEIKEEYMIVRYTLYRCYLVRNFKQHSGQQADAAMLSHLWTNAEWYAGKLLAWAVVHLLRSPVYLGMKNVSFEKRMRTVVEGEYVRTILQLERECELAHEHHKASKGFKPPNNAVASTPAATAAVSAADVVKDDKGKDDKTKDDKTKDDKTKDDKTKDDKTKDDKTKDDKTKDDKTKDDKTKDDKAKDDKGKGEKVKNDKSKVGDKGKDKGKEKGKDDKDDNHASRSASSSAPSNKKGKKDDATDDGHQSHPNNKNSKARRFAAKGSVRFPQPPAENQEKNPTSTQALTRCKFFKFACLYL